MKYSFDLENEIKRCVDCPFCTTDDYKADGCNLMNDYLDIDTSKKIDDRCLLIKCEE